MNYHTHSRWCDGRDEIRDVVEAALAAGLRQVGISSHAPVPFPTTYALAASVLPAYRAEVLRLRDEYQGRIDVLLGLELDAIPALVTYNRETTLPLGFDYTIGSVHYVGEYDSGLPWPVDTTSDDFDALLERRFAGNIGALVEEYYQLAGQLGEHPGVDIVGHLDRGAKLWNADDRLFSESEPWYRAAVDGALRRIAASGTIVELSTGGWRKGLGAPFPSLWILRRCRELGIRVTPSTDSHRPSDVTFAYDCALDALHSTGYREIAIYDSGSRVWRDERLPV